MKMNLGMMIVALGLGCKSSPPAEEEAQGVLVDGSCVYPMGDHCDTGCPDLPERLLTLRSADYSNGGGYLLWRCGDAGSGWAIDHWLHADMTDTSGWETSYFDADGVVVATGETYEDEQACGEDGGAFTVYYGSPPDCDSCLYEWSTAYAVSETCTGGATPPI